MIYQVLPRSSFTRAGSDGAEDAPAPALSFEEAEQLLLLPETTALRYGQRSVKEIPGFHYEGSNGQQPFHGIFFEPELPIRRPSMAYKWITSGGLKGSTVWPHDHLKARVRRRYGKVTERPKKGEPAVPGGQVAEGGFVIPPLPALFLYVGNPSIYMTASGRVRNCGMAAPPSSAARPTAS